MLINKIYFQKSFFLTWRLPDPIKSDPVVRKKKFQQIWKEDILINYSNAKNVIFGINYN
jgi:hypothetical protein